MVNRRGATSIEAVGVVTLVVVGVLIAIHSLGFSSVTTFQEVASGMQQGKDTRGAVASEDVALIVGGIERFDAMDQQSGFSMMISIACLIFLGWLYLRLWKARHAELKKTAEQVREIEKQSYALRKVLQKRNAVLNLVDENLGAILHGYARVGTFMSTNVMCINPETSKDDALKRMKQQGFRRFMVVRNDGQFVGVVSKKDIVSKNGSLVSDVMTSRPKITKPNTEIHTAVTVLLENRISCLPVVEDGMLVGLLSVTDLLMVLQCLLLDLRMRNESHVAKV